MVKKLVYSFYLSKETYYREINQIHFKCLEHYANIFDKVSITLLCDDIKDRDLIKDVIGKFLSLPFRSDITFNIVPNHEFRESYVFKTEVVDRFGEDDLVFFGHNKGITNVETHDKETIYKWVIGMYFYSLNFMDEVIYSLIDRPYLSYGSFLTENKDDITLKHQWAYIGTFFWINSKKLKNFVHLNNIELPVISDRFYDECFLGNVYQRYLLAASHGDQFIIDAYDYYHNTEDYIRVIYGEAKDFYEFYNNIIDKI